jgi:hypothetical protein
VSMPGGGGGYCLGLIVGVGFKARRVFLVTAAVGVARHDRGMGTMGRFQDWIFVSGIPCRWHEGVELGNTGISW